MYYQKDGIRISGQIRVRYEEHPWITRFEVDGIVAKPPGRREMRTIKENEMIIGYINSHGSITRARVESICGCGRRHAYTLLHMLIDEGFIVLKGSSYIRSHQ